jgi:hypothetical protein
VGRLDGRAVERENSHFTPIDRIIDLPRLQLGAPAGNQIVHVKDNVPEHYIQLTFFFSCKKITPLLRHFKLFREIASGNRNCEGGYLNNLNHFT